MNGGTPRSTRAREPVRHACGQMVSIPVELTASDGLTIRGELAGTGDRWAVLVHDEGRDLDGWRPLRQPLLDCGLSVLAVDLRGHGASDEPWSPDDIRLDVAATIDYARAEGARRVYGIGAGLGATALIATAAGHDLDAIVALSPRDELPGLAAGGLRITRAPKLIIVGAADESAMAQAQAVYRGTLGWRVLETRAITAHGTDQLTAPGHDHVVERTVAFLGDYA